MKHFIRYTVLSVLMLTLFVPTAVKAANITDVSNVVIDKGNTTKPKLDIEQNRVTLRKGGSKELDVDVKMHEEVSDVYKIHWTSSNKKVATVSDDGKVKAKRAGTCTVKARLGGTKVETKCKVTVKTTKGRKLRYGSRFDKKVTAASLRKRGGVEFSDNAGNTYVKGKKLGNFVITGYCTHCNSGSARATSSGRSATAGITVAVNSAQIPLGTKLVIGDHVYVAQDRHGNRNHKRVIDVFFGARHGSECFLTNIPVYYAK